MGNRFLASPPHENTVIRPLLFVFHPCLLVSRLLCPVLGQQETPPHVRYLETLWDLDCVCVAIIVGDGELECAFSFDC